MIPCAWEWERPWKTMTIMDGTWEFTWSLIEQWLMGTGLGLGSHLA
jgi:hypothetical protein